MAVNLAARHAARSTPRWTVLLAAVTPWLGLAAASHQGAATPPGPASAVAEPPATTPAIPTGEPPAVIAAAVVDPTAPAAPSSVITPPAAGPAPQPVERARVVQAIEQPATLAGSVRAQPWAPDGRMTGVRLVGDATRWPLGELGLQPDDVIHAVNGRVLDSPDRALELYWRFQRADRISLQVERAGHELTLSYAIQ